MPFAAPSTSKLRAPRVCTLAFGLGLVACTIGEPEPDGNGNPAGAGGSAPNAGSSGTGTSGKGGGSAGTSGTASGAGSTAAGAAGRGGMSAGGASGSGTAGGAGGGNSAGGSSGGGASGSGGALGGGSAGAGAGGGAGSGTSGSAGSGTAGTGAAMPTAGCGKAPPASDRYSIDVDGTTREYILDVPSDYDQNHPYRLIFGWHPLGGSAQQIAGGGYYGLESESEGSAIFVAAEGLPFQGSSLGWGNTDGRDLAFLEAMLERFRAELCFDETRIFSTGFSFGGMMSFAVGCAMNGVMRAVAPQAGNIQVSGCEDGARPVAVMGFHGTEDSVVAIDGGRAGRDVFIERNGCTEQTEPLEPSWCDGLEQSNQPCSCVNYQGCSAGYPVIWCEFNGPHTPAPNSGATIWNFFAGF